MSVSTTNLGEYNVLARELLEPFGDDEISTTEDNFSYVDPARYRLRLLKAFPNGYTFLIRDYTVQKTGLLGMAYFKGVRDDVMYEFNVPFFEKYIVGAKKFKNDNGEWVDNPKAGEILRLEQVVQMSTSAGLKSVCREMGLGLHLYEKAPKKAGTPGAAGSSAPRSSGGGGGYTNTSFIANTPEDEAKLENVQAWFDDKWDGSAVIGFTGQKGKKYVELEDGMINFLCEKMTDKNSGKRKADTNALKERARRAKNAEKDGSNNAASALTDEDEIPF